jgi:hypothetical protein
MTTHFGKGIFVAALFTVLVLGGATCAQEGGALPAQLPHGNYAVSCTPFMGSGYESLPVLVTSVTSELNGVAVTKVAIENRTDKTLSSVRLVWYLSAKESPEVVLQQGRTRLLNLRRAGGIEAGETREVIAPVIAFADIYKPLLRDGAVNGKYLIQVAVGEARFADGSTQSLMASGRGKARAVTFTKAAYMAPLRPLRQTFCPNQQCSTVMATDGTPIGYNCTSGVGQSCTNSANGRSCTSNICGTSGGGGRPPVEP